MPKEIIGSIEKTLEESKLSRIATCNVPEGFWYFFYFYSINLVISHGYQLEIEGKTYNFPFFKRAPPESYLS